MLYLLPRYVTRLVPQFRAQPRHETRDVPRQQVQHHHARRPDIGLEQVTLHELDAIRDALVCRTDSRHFDELRLQLDADSARAEALGRRDHQPPVSRTEVVDHVLATDIGEFQHLIDDHPRRGYVGAGDVVLRVVEVLREGGGGGAQRERGCNTEEKRIHPGSSTRSSRPFSANTTDCRRTLSRPPRKRRVTLSIAPRFRDHAKHTVPTGFAFVPPAGPATPVTAIETCARLRASAPAAISWTVSRLTAPCRERVRSRTPSISLLASLE